MSGYVFKIQLANAAMVKPVRQADKVMMLPTIRKILTTIACEAPIAFKIAISPRFCVMRIKRSETMLMLATRVMSARIKNIAYFSNFLIAAEKCYRKSCTSCAQLPRNKAMDMIVDIV